MVFLSLMTDNVFYQEGLVIPEALEAIEIPEALEKIGTNVNDECL
jgi:hypothetical protein